MTSNKVLLVEDDEFIRAIVADALIEGGLEPIALKSGEEAIEWLQAGPAAVSALVTDINLGRGRIRGWEVARRTRGANPRLPVVYITGDSAGEWSAEGVPNSVLVTKPFQTGQVLQAVQRLLNPCGDQHLP